MEVKGPTNKEPSLLPDQLLFLLDEMALLNPTSCLYREAADLIRRQQEENAKLVQVCNGQATLITEYRQKAEGKHAK